MTKKALLPLIAVGLVFSSFAAVEINQHHTATAQAAKKSQLKVFNSPDGSFKVLIPRMPKSMR